MITWLFFFKSRPFRIKPFISMLLLLNKTCLEFWFGTNLLCVPTSNCHLLCELPSCGRVPKKRVNGVCMHATMAYGNMEVQLQSFLTWTFSAGHWSPSQLWPLYCLGKWLQYPFSNRMSGHSSSEHFGEGKYTLPFGHLANRLVTVLTMLSSLIFQLWCRKKTKEDKSMEW